VVLRRSIRIGRAPSCYRTALPRRRVVFFCELLVRGSTGGPGPVSVRLRCEHRSAATCPDGTPPFRFSGHVFNAPLLFNAPLAYPSHFGPRGLQDLTLESPPKSGQKSPVPAASTGRRNDQSGTLQETTGGTQTHSRRTGSKLGRLQRARQGIVRVPESNTKYGGKAGKTRGAQPLRCRQLSVSPGGFPSKKFLALGARRASPRCSQENYLLRPVAAQGVALRRLT